MSSAVRLATRSGRSGRTVRPERADEFDGCPIAAFGAGRVLGLDQYIEQYDVGGEALVERYPWLRYLLG
ncbi:hypothetical protein GCM10009000_101600 [Halobacterium noricense]